uniref:Uncharacterized protein n=1 Tax=Ixodes ricinus TaxID=34613 RepID=A0A6B0ULT1_IXORI
MSCTRDDASSTRVAAAWASATLLRSACCTSPVCKLSRSRLTSARSLAFILLWSSMAANLSCASVTLPFISSSTRSSSCTASSFSCRLRSFELSAFSITPSELSWASFDVASAASEMF